jgi:hypothetical protein
MEKFTTSQRIDIAEAHMLLISFFFIRHILRQRMSLKGHKAEASEAKQKRKIKIIASDMLLKKFFSTLIFCSLNDDESLFSSRFMLSLALDQLRLLATFFDEMDGL